MIALPGCIAASSFTAPTGSEIQGTYEMAPGAAAIRFGDTPSEFEHTGEGTKVFWDGMTTQTVDGGTVFLCDNGDEWLEHHLIPEGAEPLSGETVAAMGREFAIGQALDQAKRLTEMLDGLASTNGVTTLAQIPVDMLRQELLGARTHALALKKRDLDAAGA